MATRPSADGCDQPTAAPARRVRSAAQSSVSDPRGGRLHGPIAEVCRVETGFAEQAHAKTGLGCGSMSTTCRWPPRRGEVGLRDSETSTYLLRGAFSDGARAGYAWSHKGRAQAPAFPARQRPDLCAPPCEAGRGTQVPAPVAGRPRERRIAAPPARRRGRSTWRPWPVSLRWFEPNTCHHLRKRPAGCEFSRLADRFSLSRRVSS